MTTGPTFIGVNGHDLEIFIVKKKTKKLLD
jgi:hypothetical protein